MATLKAFLLGPPSNIINLITNKEKRKIYILLRIAFLKKGGVLDHGVPCHHVDSESAFKWYPS